MRGAVMYRRKSDLEAALGGQAEGDLPCRNRGDRQEYAPQQSS
jgi:hypothetical protein